MNLAEVVSTWRSDGLIEQFLTADAPKQLAHFLHEFLTDTTLLNYTRRLNDNGPTSAISLVHFQLN